jgi:hypothetical protein
MMTGSVAYLLAAKLGCGKRQRFNKARPSEKAERVMGGHAEQAECMAKQCWM